MSARPVRLDAAPGARVGAAIAAARQAQPAWAGVGPKARLEVLSGFRHRLARRAEEVAATVTLGRRSAAETVAAEIHPLADAVRFLERRAPGLLRPRRAGGWGPAWLGGVALEVRREPLGVVLVVAPGNYPLLLPGVQALQALAAGNAVLLKPAPGGVGAARALAELLGEAGLPAGLLGVLGESPRDAEAAIEAGVERVVLTGSADTGRRVLAALAPRLTPATLELSGCDACFVLADADLELVARSLLFGLTFNGGATCIAPRRIFVVGSERAAELAGRLGEKLADRPPVEVAGRSERRLREVVDDAVARGGRIVAGGAPSGGVMAPTLIAGAEPRMALFAADLMAPIAGLCAVDGEEEALAAASACPYALGASVFGRPDSARRLAGRVTAGVVVINDLIVPTADPRVAFGGGGESGFGRTRGAEGLLEMTATKTVVRRRTRWRPHLAEPRPGDDRALFAMLRLAHAGTLRERLSALGELTRAGRTSPTEGRSRPERRTR